MAYKIRKRQEKISQSDRETRQIIEQPINELKAKEFLNINEACKLVGISRRTLYRLIEKEQLSPLKIGSRTIIKRSDLDSLLFSNVSFEDLTPDQQQEKPEFDFEQSYTVKEIQEKYGISEKALHDLIVRNGIQKAKKGWYTYVPKIPIDELFDITH